MIISTSSEYGHTSTKIKKINTKFKRKPKGAYDVSKAVFTDMIKKLSKNKTNKNCKFRIMRLFPIYGTEEKRYRLYPSLKKAANEGKNFLIKNPYEFRDFTNSRYASKVLLDACNFKKKAKKFEIYHLSSNKNMTVLKFAKSVWKKFKAKGKLLENKKNIFLSSHVSDKRSTWKLKNAKY